MPALPPQRRPGLDLFIDRCQLLGGRIVAATPAELLVELHEITSAIPGGLTVIEQRLVRSVLSQTCGRIVRTVSLDRHAEIAEAFLAWESVPFDDGEWRRAWSRLVASCGAALGGASPVVGGTTEESAHPERGASACVDRVLRLIDARYRDPDLSLSAVARQVNMSPWHVARTLTRQTGYGFVAHLRRARVTESRRLLVENRLSMKEIAAAVGYAHRNRLDRDFMRMCGVTPSAFRSHAIALGRDPRNGSSATWQETMRDRKK